MKALVLDKPAGTPHLTDFETPSGVDGDVVEVVAAALNPVDVAQAAGEAQQVPRVVGNEAVIRYGGGLAYADQTIDPAGSIAEQTVVHLNELVEIPDDLSPAAAVAVGIPGVAAWMSLSDVGGLRPGETVLVLGATGDAGRLAVQVARLLGAGRIVAAGRSREKLEPLRDLGADEIAVLGGEDDVAIIRDAARGDVDLAFDPLFGTPLQTAVAALGPTGRAVSIGMSAGQTVELDFPSFLGKRLLTHLNMTADPHAKASAYRQLIGHLHAGELSVDVEEITLADAESAWQRQVDGPERKLVIRP